MQKVAFNKYIVADPNICHGKPTFKGTRVMVWQVLELLKAGIKPSKIFTSYPNLPPQAIESALDYAVQKTKGTSYVFFDKEKGFRPQVFAG